MADIYINDAFSVSHRAHSSLCGIPKFLPSYFGLCMSKEIESLQNSLSTPKKPLLAIIGGSKILTKIDILKNLNKKVDTKPIIKSAIDTKNRSCFLIGLFDINCLLSKVYKKMNSADEINNVLLPTIIDEAKIVMSNGILSFLFMCFT